MQNCGMPPPPPFRTWAEGLSTQMVGEDLCFWPALNFGPKNELNLSEGLFFWTSPSFGQKSGLILSADLFWTEKLDRFWVEKFSF